MRADVTLFSSQTKFVKDKFHQKSSRSLFVKKMFQLLVLLFYVPTWFAYHMLVKLILNISAENSQTVALWVRSCSSNVQVRQRCRTAHIFLLLILMKHNDNKEKSPTDLVPKPFEVSHPHQSRPENRNFILKVNFDWYLGWMKNFDEYFFLIFLQASHLLQ